MGVARKGRQWHCPVQAYMQRWQNTLLLRECFADWVHAKEAASHRAELERAHEAVSELWRNCQSRLHKDGVRAQVAEGMVQRLSMASERAFARAWHFNLTERSFFAWRLDVRGSAQDSAVRRAWLHHRVASGSTLDFLWRAQSRLLLRRCLQALALAVRTRALSSLQAAAQRDVAARLQQAAAQERSADAVRFFILGREARDVLRLSWLFWHGLALAARLERKAFADVEAYGASLRRSAVSFRGALVCSSQALRDRICLHVTFACLASARESARRSAHAAETSVWVHKHIERSFQSVGRAAAIAVHAWAARCERSRYHRRLATWRWRFTALNASRRCLAEWARLAGARPIDARGLGLVGHFPTPLLHGVPGCVANEPLAEAPPLHHPASYRSPPSVLPWDELTVLVATSPVHKPTQW